MITLSEQERILLLDTLIRIEQIEEKWKPTEKEKTELKELEKTINTLLT